MAWAKSKQFLEKMQLASIVLYLVCLGGYVLPVVEDFFDTIRADIFGFAFFSLFLASTVLLSFEKGSGEDADASPQAEANPAKGQ